MPLTYRNQKGAPLTVEELDSNFKELEGRIQNLENHTGETIGKVELEGNQLTFMGSYGTIFGTVTLPKVEVQQTYPPLPVYEKDTLPTSEQVGRFALLMSAEGLALIFFDGQKWNTLKKGDIP